MINSSPRMTKHANTIRNSGSEFFVLRDTITPTSLTHVMVRACTKLGKPELLHIDVDLVPGLKNKESLADVVFDTFGCANLDYHQQHFYQNFKLLS